MSRSRSLSSATLVVAWTAAFAQDRPADASVPGQRAAAVPKYVAPLRDYRAFADSAPRTTSCSGKPRRNREAERASGRLATRQLVGARRRA